MVFVKIPYLGLQFRIKEITPFYQRKYRISAAPSAVKNAQNFLILWHPRRDLNPCYRRESTRPSRLYKNLEGAGGAVNL
jgi:hypothetical protein